jgi:outer membrane lipoprotein SlyB
MNTPYPVAPEQTSPRRAAIHPLMAAAAVSVIGLAATGVASMTGLIGSRAAQPEPAPLVAAPAQAAPPAIAAPAAATPAPAARAPAPRPQAAPRPVAAAQPAQPAQPAPPVQVASAPQPAPVAEAPRPVVPVADPRSWATVESVRTVRTGGTAQGIGAVSGAVLGGVLGHQVGGGTGKKVATVVGAVGGGVLGHQAERQIRGETKYEATVRLDDGSQRTFVRTTPWNLQAGERVRVVDDTLAVAPGQAPAPSAPMREAVYSPGG